MQRLFSRCLIGRVAARSIISTRLCSGSGAPPAQPAPSIVPDGAGAFTAAPVEAPASETTSPAAVNVMFRAMKARDAHKATKAAAEHFDKGEFVEAERLWRSAVNDLSDARVGMGEDAAILGPLGNLACAVGELGRAKEKLELLQRHNELVQRVYGASHPEFVVSCHNLAAALGDLGRPHEMLRVMEQGLTLQRQICGPRAPHHPKVARMLLGVADALGRLGRQEERRRVLEQAAPIVERHLKLHHPQVAVVFLSLADCCLLLGDVDESARLGQRALEIETKVFQAANPHLMAHSRLLLAKVHAYRLLHDKCVRGSENGDAAAVAEVETELRNIARDVRRHGGESAKILSTVYAQWADFKRQLLEAHTGSTPGFRFDTPAALEQAAQEAAQLSEAAYQIALRHFDNAAHPEIARRMTHVAITDAACARACPALFESIEGGWRARCLRWATEAERRLTSLNVEADYSDLIDAREAVKRFTVSQN